MKATSKNINNAGSNKVARASIILSLIAFVLSLYVFLAGQANAVTFSSIGNANRVWFFFYSLTFVFAFSFNIIIFTLTTLKKNKRLSILIYILLGLTIISSVLQSIIIGPSVQRAHVLLASLFTAFGCLALIIAIAAKIKFTKSKHGYFYFFIISTTGGINFYAIYVYGWLIASYQWLFAATVLASSSALALISYADS